MATHTGTHMDAPLHFGGKDKWSVADIPLENLIDIPVHVVDIVAQSQKERDYQMTVDDLMEYEQKHGPIESDSVVIIRTGWSRFWPNKLDYFGTDTNDDKLTHFPGLHPTAAQWLVDKRIVGLGIDGPSVDCGQCVDYASHIVLNQNNIYTLENLEQSIFELPQTGAKLTVLPLKLADSSGCPVRPIATFMHHHHHHPHGESHPLNNGHMIGLSSVYSLCISLIIIFNFFNFLM